MFCAARDNTLHSSRADGYVARTHAEMLTTESLRADGHRLEAPIRNLNSNWLGGNTFRCRVPIPGPTGQLAMATAAEEMTCMVGPSGLRLLSTIWLGDCRHEEDR